MIQGLERGAASTTGGRGTFLRSVHHRTGVEKDPHSFEVTELRREGEVDPRGATLRLCYSGLAGGRVPPPSLEGGSGAFPHLEVADNRRMRVREHELRSPREDSPSGTCRRVATTRAVATQIPLLT